MPKEKLIPINVNLTEKQLDFLEELRKKNGFRSISETLRHILDKHMGESKTKR